MRHVRSLPPLVVLLALFAGCATVEEGRLPEYRRARAEAIAEAQGGSVEGARVAAAALDLVGERNLTVAGRRFNFDCTGTILAAYYAAGYDLAAGFGAYSGNGVSRLYAMSEDQGTLRYREPLKPGDIVFWDNSYDRNGDGRWNDELTHAGIIVDVSGDGTVTFVHHNYREGVVTATMNITRPDDQNRNSPMRMASHRWRASDPWLSGELYRAHGALYE